MSSCFVTGCTGFGQWQMGVQVGIIGADEATAAPESIALGLSCCEVHRLDPPDPAAFLPATARTLVNNTRIADGLAQLDFDSTRVVFREYLTNGGEWHR
jgi:hypothetical protein